MIDRFLQLIATHPRWILAWTVFVSALTYWVVDINAVESDLRVLVAEQERLDQARRDIDITDKLKTRYTRAAFVFALMWMHAPTPEEIEAKRPPELEKLVEDERKRANAYRRELGDIINEFQASGVSHSLLTPLLASMITDITGFDRQIGMYQLQMSILKSKNLEKAKNQVDEADAIQEDSRRLHSAPALRQAQANETITSAKLDFNNSALSLQARARQMMNRKYVRWVCLGYIAVFVISTVGWYRRTLRDASPSPTPPPPGDSEPIRNQSGDSRQANAGESKMPSAELQQQQQLVTSPSAQPAPPDQQ